MFQRGSLLVFGIIFVAMLAGIVTLIVTWSRGNQALQYWGTESAYDIRHAKVVELLVVNQLDDDSDPKEATFGTKNIHWKAIQRIDISKAKGLTHMRQALIEDASYTWGQPLPQCDSTWSHALIFSGDKQPLTVLINLECGLLAKLGDDPPINAGPIKDGLQEVFNEQLELGAEKQATTE